MGGVGLADTTKFQSEADGGYATTARRLPHESRRWHFRRQLRASGFDVLVRNIDLVLALAVTVVATGVIRDGGAGQRVIDVLQLLVELDLGNRGLGVLERAFGIPELFRDGGDIDIECLQIAGDVLQRGARHPQFHVEFRQRLWQDEFASEAAIVSLANWVSSMMRCSSSPMRFSNLEMSLLFCSCSA